MIGTRFVRGNGYINLLLASLAHVWSYTKHKLDSFSAVNANDERLSPMALPLFYNTIRNTKKGSDLLHDIFIRAAH